MLLRNILVLSLLAVMPASMADTIDINLRDKCAQLQYIASMNRDTPDSSELHAGFLYNSKNDYMGDFGLLVKGAVGERETGFVAGVGLKGIVATVSDVNAAALALGGYVRYSIPAMSRLSIVGQAYFSPSIATYYDAERFAEGTARLEYEIIPRASAYVGYRRIRFSIAYRPDAVLDRGYHLGARILF